MKLVRFSTKKLVMVFIILVMTLSALTEIYPYLWRVLYYPVYRDYVRQGFINECSNYSVLKSGSIKVYYKDEIYDSAVVVAENAAESMDRLLLDLDYSPDDDVSIIIYPEYDKMAHMMSLGTGSPALGAYYCGTVGIYDPDGTYVLKPNRKSLVLHELTHYMLDYMSEGNMPAWFTEGVALYEEYKVYGTEWASGKNYSYFYSLEEMEKDFYSLDEVKAYKESFMIVKYIGDNFGSDGINNIIKGLKSGKPMKQVLCDTLGMEIPRLLAESLR